MTEDSVIHCEMNDLKSQDRTEIIVSAAQNNLIEKLKKDEIKVTVIFFEKPTQD